MPQTNKRLKSFIEEIGTSIDLVEDSCQRVRSTRDPNDYLHALTVLFSDIDLLVRTHERIDEEIYRRNEQTQPTSAQASPPGGVTFVAGTPGQIRIPPQPRFDPAQFQPGQIYTFTRTGRLPSDPFSTAVHWGQSPAQPEQVPTPPQEDAPPWLTGEGNEVPPERPR